MSKKIIFITITLTLVVISLVFVAFKSFGYSKLKNDCVKNNNSQNGYSATINFNQSVSQADIDMFVNRIKKMSGVTSVESKTKEEALQEFKNEQANDPEVLKELSEIGFNPLSSSITITSNINDINIFLDLEKTLLNQAETSGLKTVSHHDGNLAFIQEQLAKVSRASLIKDLFSYIFSGEGNHFFENNYSSICNPNFKRTFPFNN